MITWQCGRLNDYSTFVPRSAPMTLRRILEDALRRNTVLCFISDTDQDPAKEEIFLMGKVVVCRYCALSVFMVGIANERIAGQRGIAQHGCRY